MTSTQHPSPVSTCSASTGSWSANGGAAFRMIQPGEDYCINDWHDRAEAIRLACTRAEQRNWSRVGAGEVAKGAMHGERRTVFIKQYVDRAGRPQYRHWAFEQTGTNTACALFRDMVRIPALRGSDAGLLLNVYEHVNVVPLDVLLRFDTIAFDAVFPTVLVRMRSVLETMALGLDARRETEHLPVKERPYGGPSRAVNFKGFDIRNVGLLRDADGKLQTGEVALFDFGRAYLAPIEEAAAKLFVSIGLLNWGKPARRFLRGPDVELLNLSFDVLKPYMNADALEAELALQESFRSSEAQGGSRMERRLKRLGIDTIGKRYLRRLRVWHSRCVR